MALETLQPDEVANSLQKTRFTLNQAITLLNNISILMKHQLSVSYELEPINLAMTIEKVISLVQDTYPSRKIEVTAPVPFNSFVLADLLFEHIFINLLTNAVKNDPHDIVRVKITIEQVQDHPEDNVNYIISVTDFGTGIHPDQRVNLFTRFTEFRKKGRGSGLGFFIIKTLAERYNGRIWIENRISDDYTQGTCFKIQLQAA
ncbi:MAG: sensor histidine kinase [Candidatus Hodarchaeota archaeon]